MSRRTLSRSPLTDELTANRVLTSQWIVFGLTLAVLTALFAAIGMQSSVFDFRFNPFALFSLVAVISNVGAFVLISRIKVKSDDLMWFALHLFALGVWAVSEMLVRLSANVDAAIFWSAIGSLGSFFMPAAFYMFALAYTSPRLARHPMTVVPLMMTTLCVLFFDFRTTFFNNYSPNLVANTPWGYWVTPGPYYWIVICWIIVLYVVAISVLMRFRQKTLEPTLKAQTSLFVIATIIPVFGGLATDGLLPMLGVVPVLPVAVLLTSVMGVTIAYGLRRYRFFTFNPLLVAANVLDTMNEAVISIRPNFEINYVNKGAERLLGYSHKEFSRLRLTDFLSQKWNLGLLKKALLRPLEHDASTQFDSVDLRTAQGVSVTVKLSISKVTDDGALQGYLVVMTDITKIARATEIIERTVEEQTREVQETEATLATSINSLKMGFVILDKRPEVIRLNRVAHELLCPNYRRHAAAECQEVTAERTQAIMGPAVSLARLIATCLQRQLPHEIKDISFNDRNWRIYLSPMVVEKESIGCVLLLQDTTEERMLERSRDEFFSIASHELRTPLTSIKGNSSMIMQYYAAVLKDPVLKEMVDDIHDSSGRLIEIVNDFLDVSRLEQNRIEFHFDALPISKIVGEVAYGMNAMIKQKGLQLRLTPALRRLDALPNVIVDRNRVKQILFNLIGNAVKFTEKGRITVDAQVQGGILKLTVADNGMGIAAEEQSLLFRKFQQASSSILTRDVSRGTGLGLYISRLLAEGMNGSLELEKSELGKGTTFALTLPVATPVRLKHLAQLKATKQADLASAH